MTVRHLLSDRAGLSYGLQPSFTGTTSTYTAIRAEGITFDPQINMIPVAYQKAEDMRGPDADIIGAYGGALSFTVPVRSGAGSGSPFIALAKYCGATVYSITDATAHITGGTSTTFTISTTNAAAHGLTTAMIGVGLLVTPTTGDASLRFATAITVTSNVMTVTVNKAWNHNPVNGDHLLGTDTIVPATGEPTKYVSFKHYIGQGSTDKLLWTVNGAAGTWKLGTTEAGAIPMASFEYECDNWTDAETSASTAVKAADTFNPAKPVLADPFYLEGTQTDIKSIEFDPGLKKVPLATTYGTHGRSGFWYTGSEPVLNFLPYHDVDLITAWEAGTQKSAFFESLSTSAGWGLWCPEVQLTKYALADDDGLFRAGLTLKVVDPGKNANTKNYPLWSFCVSR